jgi:hypothetical protein
MGPVGKDDWRGRMRKRIDDWRDGMKERFKS